MPWKEPGSGKKDPWQSGGDQPPDLDDVFRSVSNRFRRLFGGRGGESGGPPIVMLIVLGAILWTAFDSPHVLDQSERGVVLRFGKHVRTVEPGLQFTFPRPIESLQKVNVSQILSRENRGRMLTEDENLIDVNYAVQYRVQDPVSFLFNVRDPELTLAEAAESAMREVMGTNLMDFILETGRGQVATESEELVQAILDRYETGLAVSQFNLQDVKPPQQVKDAFDDVVKAREDEQRFVNEAQAYSNKIIPEARGLAARIVQEAEAYKAERIAVADGEAQRFSLLLSEYQKAPEVTRQRLYLQTMENVLSNSSKVLMDVQGNNMLYLPLDRIANSNPARMVPPVTSSIAGAGSQSGGDSNSRRGRDTTRSGREGRP